MDHPTGKTRTPAGGRGRGRRPLPACPGPRGLCVLRRRRASAGRTEREPDSAPGPRPRSSGAHEEAQVLRPRRAVPPPPETPTHPSVLGLTTARLPPRALSSGACGLRRQVPDPGASALAGRHTPQVQVRRPRPRPGTHVPLVPLREAGGLRAPPGLAPVPAPLPSAPEVGLPEDEEY